MPFLFSACATNSIKQNELKKLQNTPSVLPDDYILGTDDTVKITVENHPEWSGEFIVGPNGKISIPSLGDVSAEGLNKKQFEAAITSRLDQYINNPRVTTNIVKYVSQVIYVLGEVNKPGKYSTEGKKLTLRDAVVNAGLPTRFAALNRTFVISSAKKHSHKRVVNLYRVLYQGDLEYNIEVKPGDIVYVPETIWGIFSDFISSLFSPFNSATGFVTIRSSGGLQ
jgi:polysaccharide export outer membrane protein